MAETLVGRTLGARYRVDAPLGSGGYGMVYRATHLELGHTVAIKTLRIDRDNHGPAAERFRREARLQVRLRHPAIVRLLDFGHEPDGTAFMVQDFVDGQTLRALIDAEGALPVTRAVGLVVQALDGLTAAHRLDIIHRDLKPENLMVSHTPFGEEIRILDFGLAKVRDVAEEASALTVSGHVVGTPTFMAPEQIEQADLSPATDLYSMGGVLFYLLSGRLPFTGTVSQILRGHLVLPVPPLPAHVPPVLVAVVERAMVKAPRWRFQTAVQMKRALAEAMHAYAELGSAAGAPAPVVGRIPPPSPDRPGAVPSASWDSWDEASPLDRGDEPSTAVGLADARSVPASDGRFAPGSDGPVTDGVAASDGPAVDRAFASHGRSIDRASASDGPATERASASDERSIDRASDSDGPATERAFTSDGSGAAFGADGLTPSGDLETAVEGRAIERAIAEPARVVHGTDASDESAVSGGQASAGPDEPPASAALGLDVPPASAAIGLDVPPADLRFGGSPLPTPLPARDEALLGRPLEISDDPAPVVERTTPAPLGPTIVAPDPARRMPDSAGGATSVPPDRSPGPSEPLSAASLPIPYPVYPLTPRVRDTASGGLDGPRPEPARGSEIETADSQISTVEVLSSSGSGPIGVALDSETRPGGVAGAGGRGRQLAAILVVLLGSAVGLWLAWGGGPGDRVARDGSLAATAPIIDGGRRGGPRADMARPGRPDGSRDQSISDAGSDVGQVDSARLADGPVDVTPDTSRRRRRRRGRTSPPPPPPPRTQDQPPRQPRPLPPLPPVVDAGRRPPPDAGPKPSRGALIRKAAEFERLIHGCKCEDLKHLLDDLEASEPSANLDHWKRRYQKVCILVGCGKDEE